MINKSKLIMLFIAVIAIMAFKKSENLSYIEFTTTKSVGDEIELIIEAKEEDKKDVWIDLNYNDKKDKGEDKIIFGEKNGEKIKYKSGKYILGSQTIRIYGKVTVFSSYRGKITKLDVSNNKYLERLSSIMNKFTSLDLSKNVNLKHLVCNYNKFKILDVSNNKKLEKLNCELGELEELKIGENVNLTEVKCGKNKLSYIDNLGLPNLKKLICSYNRLTKLDVSKNSKLEKLNFTLNRLIKCVNVNKKQLNLIPESWDKSVVYSLKCKCY